MNRIQSLKDLVSNESMVRGKSVRNHPNASVTRRRAPVCLCVVPVYGPWEVRTKSSKYLSHMKHVAHVRKIYMLNLQPRDNSTIQNSSKHRADSQCMPCDFLRIYTGLVLSGPVSGPVDYPKASCDLGIKYLMLIGRMHDTRVCPGL